MALQLRRKTHESIVYIDKDSAPRIMPFGEDFILEDIPVGTRVIYPNPPIKGLPNREAAIRYAINHPIDAKPLYAQLEPGMRVTIAMDDISLPLPPMQTPDLRQTMLEVVLDMCASNGVDDVHLIIANSLHRKMTAWEMERMVGSTIFNEFYPDRFYNHDAEDDENLIKIGETRHDEPLRVNRRAIESDILIYLNLNLVPMDGGHKSVAVGLCDYESLRQHHEPQTIRDSDSYMDPPKSALNHKVIKLGKLVDEHCNVFHIETAINNKMFPEGYDILTRNEDEFSFMDRMKWEAMKRTFSNLPRGARRKLLHKIPAQYELIGCFAGETEKVHEKILELNYRQYEIPVKGQCDILISGIPDISPYN
ncbi:MAG TPA: lactate racemase domain-containing protein, partial [Pyrinomonadaceae bacterium]